MHIAEKYYRWSYQLMVAFAKELLKRMNEERKHENDWPAGSKWEGLGNSSKSVFLRKARELAGINHDEYLKPVREGKYDVELLFSDNRNDPDPKTAKFILVRGIKEKNKFFTTNVPTEDQTKIYTGEVWYEILGYANSTKEAQMKLFGRVYG